MKIKNLVYTALVGVAAVAIVIGSATTSEAKHYKASAPPPPPPQPQVCLYTYQPVCGSLKGHLFTYANSCAAWKDGANIVSWNACPVKKAHRYYHHRYYHHRYYHHRYYRHH